MSEIDADQQAPEAHKAGETDGSQSEPVATAASATDDGQVAPVAVAAGLLDDGQPAPLRTKPAKSATTNSAIRHGRGGCDRRAGSGIFSC